MAANTTYQDDKTLYLKERKSKIMSPKEFKDEYNIKSMHKVKKIIESPGFPMLKVERQQIIIRSEVDAWFKSNIGLII